LQTTTTIRTATKSYDFSSRNSGLRAAIFLPAVLGIGRPARAEAQIIA
jgi:hypothetical protein